MRSTKGGGAGGPRPSTSHGDEEGSIQPSSALASYQVVNSASLPSNELFPKVRLASS